MQVIRYTYNLEPQERKNEIRESVHVIDRADVLKGHIDLETESKVHREARFGLDVEVGLVYFRVRLETLHCLQERWIRLVEMRVGESDRKTC